MLQLSFKNGSQVTQPPSPRSAATLVDLAEGENAIIESLDLPDDLRHRLMEFGFFPGAEVTAGRCAPGGDPRVFQVDGSEFALRRETARHLFIRKPSAAHPPVSA